MIRALEADYQPGQSNAIVAQRQDTLKIDDIEQQQSGNPQLIKAVSDASQP
ncbi:hypothetical protein [Cobetia sp. Dlab-2-AX]|uniref:hypothetical protein n=1 Tax=Cobetia sp. Dlab-2-AX TaxID=2954488 RepID=UPI0020978BC2|nr:hypothetical protein [Cobetia sp. Dlab-2-AX]